MNINNNQPPRSPNHAVPDTDAADAPAAVAVPDLPTHSWLSARPLFRANRLPSLQSCDEKLHQAVRDGDCDAVRMQLQAGAKPHMLLPDGRTLLHMALDACHEAVFEILVGAESINLNQTNRQGETPLATALLRGLPECAKLLLAHPALDAGIPDHRNSTPLMIAASQGRTAIMQLMADRSDCRVNATNAQGETALHLVARYHQSAVLPILARMPGIDLNALTYKGATALHLAVAEGDALSVAALASADGMDPNIRNEEGVTALHLAVRNGQDQVVSALLPAPGLNVNAVDSAGCTVLHRAVQHDFSAIVAALVAVPAMALNARTQRGFSAMHLAVADACRDSLRMLVAMPELEVNQTTRNGQTALHIAARNLDLESVKILLDAPGIDVNVPNRHGETALLLASWKDQVEMALTFLHHPGIDPNGVLPLLGVQAIADHFLIQPGVADVANDRAILPTLLKQWAAFVPPNGKPNRFLTSATNYEIGMHLAGMSPADNSDCPQDAAFYFGLSLEQSLNYHGHFNEQAQHAAIGLLRFAPENTATFNLGGIEVLRSDVEEMAQARGRYAVQGAMAGAMGDIVRDGFAANVHMPGFLLRGRDILARLQQYEGAVTLAQATEAIRTMIEEHLVDPAAASELGQMVSDFHTSQSVLPESGSSAEQQYIEAQISTRIEAAQPALRAAWVQQQMRYGLTQTLLRTDPVDEQGMQATAPETLRLLHGYIQAQPEQLKLQLQQALLQRLADIGNEPGVCNTGCVQRLLDTPAGLDPALMAGEPDAALIHAEVSTIAGRVNNAFEQAYLSDEPPQPHDPEQVIALKRDILQATVMDDLVRRRGWRRTAVQLQLQPVSDSMQFV